jgi:hypothetical protein
MLFPVLAKDTATPFHGDVWEIFLGMGGNRFMLPMPAKKSLVRFSIPKMYSIPLGM